QKTHARVISCKQPVCRTFLGGVTMNRRQFCARLAALGGPLALMPFVQACAPISPGHSDPDRSSPSANAPEANTAMATNRSPAAETATVALVRTIDRCDGVRRALELLGINPVSGRDVLVK